MPSTSASLLLGKDAIRSAYFSGTLDEVNIYSRALAANEVSARYNATGSLRSNLGVALGGRRATLSYYLGGRLVAQKKGTDLQWVSQDHLTGTALVTDGAGNKIGEMKYLPFGAARSGSVPTDRRFTGQRLDGSGLYYYGARYYDPELGRFASSDPLGVSLHNPQSWNRYSYVWNNPLRYTDPSGLWTFGIGFGATGGFPIVESMQGFGVGFGASVSVMWVADQQGRMGIALSVSYGGYVGWAGLAGGPMGQHTTANTIGDLEGESFELGGTLPGIPVTGERVIAEKYTGENVTLNTHGVSKGEAHALKQHTIVISLEKHPLDIIAEEAGVPEIAPSNTIGFTSISAVSGPIWQWDMAGETWHMYDSDAPDWVKAHGGIEQLERGLTYMVNTEKGYEERVYTGETIKLR